MKLRISIILLGAAFLMNTGCSSMKSAYNGKEGSHLTNPAKIAAMNNSQNGLAPVASGPEEDTIANNTGWTAPSHMTGSSTAPQFQGPPSSADGSWGGALSTR